MTARMRKSESHCGLRYFLLLRMVEIDYRGKVILFSVVDKTRIKIKFDVGFYFLFEFLININARESFVDLNFFSGKKNVE
jgi:hypothetical protein